MATRPIRPARGGLHAALREIHDRRPEHVPAASVLLTTWVNVPGENAQRTSWRGNLGWKAVARQDFEDCLAVQGYPGILENPALHIEMQVAGRGDDNNRLARAKFLIDLLQVEVMRRDGKRARGGMNLIEDDAVFNDGNRTVTERVVRPVKALSKEYRGQPVAFAPYRSSLWVWSRDAS